MDTDIRIHGPLGGRRADVLGADALALLARLERELGARRLALLAARSERQLRFDAGEQPGFLTGSAGVRGGAWTVPPAPADLQDRRVELTGPTDPKMVINALNSGAQVFMADFEDSNTPSWTNMIDGQVTLSDAVRRRLTFRSSDGRPYEIRSDPAVLMVRPRGWHLPERHVVVDGRPVSASFFDAALYLANNAVELLERGSGPYLYLPKLESHLEAELWHDAFSLAEDHIGIPSGSIRATVLIETILAAFEMDEILHALGNHATALNAGRWDYIFSLVKKFRLDPSFVLPDRSQVTMTVPFMNAYTDLLVATCHRRGAHAIGGMAAFIPSRHDPEANGRAGTQVRADKQREASAGFDGTWVAHPDLVPVAAEAFDHVLAGRPNQLDRSRADVVPAEGSLLDVSIAGSTVTSDGVRNNVAVGLRYLESWLRGSGAAAIFSLMEDVATAEIARSQLWQWIRHGARTDDGEPVTSAMVRGLLDQEMVALVAEREAAGLGSAAAKEASVLFGALALDPEFTEFLTLRAYQDVE